MLVHVVVTDKQGKPITGLHPEDFEFEENGKTQKISTVVPAAALAARYLFEPAAVSLAGWAGDGNVARCRQHSFFRSGLCPPADAQLCPEAVLAGTKNGDFHPHRSSPVLQDFTSDQAANG